MKQTSFQTRPYLLNDGAPRFQSLGALVRIQANTQQTGGAFNVFDILCPPGYETPLHIHYAEDVAIQVLKGALAIFWGEEEREAEAGSFFFQPRGVPHGFRVRGQGPARILYLSSPAGLDTFVIEAGTATHFDCAHEAARYKIEILGSLPAVNSEVRSLKKGESK
jgi:quercetin dioxygenase-like cupin family protein